MTADDFAAWTSDRKRAHDAITHQHTRDSIRAKVRKHAKRDGHACPEWAAALTIDPATDWDAWLAERKRVIAGAPPASRASIRRRVRQRARDLDREAPAWALEVMRVRLAGKPKSAPRSAGPALAVIPANAPMRPLDLPAALVAWRKRTEGAIVHVRGNGSVTLSEPAEPGSALYTARKFASVAEAVAAV